MPLPVVLLLGLVVLIVALVAPGHTYDFAKPAPITLAEMDGLPFEGVTVHEVTDYAPGHYEGPMEPSPPHADMNARRALVIRWEDRPERFIFSHEASYCPLLELPSGAAMCNQFFEGNLGDAELFNDPGRKERNSYVDVVEATSQRVWVRWTYHCVNMNDDTHPRLRGTEDYFAYPNGLVLRRMSYESLMPGEVVGYSTQPVELFGVGPVGSTLPDLFSLEAPHGDYLTHLAFDVYSDKRYALYWTEAGGVRREGDDATLAAISRSQGCALVLPFKEKLLFAILGPASGFAPERNQLIDHCTASAEGGAGWGAGLWDHWPIGWLNSQTSYWKPGSEYPFSFGSIGQFFVPPGERIKAFSPDYFDLCKDMENNRWTERRLFTVLLGAADDLDEVRRIGRAWLDQGSFCNQPASLRKLR